MAIAVISIRICRCMKDSINKDFSFKKAERLKSRKIIDQLFNKKGKSFAIYPLRIIWMPTSLPSTATVQFTSSVSKRNFKKAVSRNRIKRQIREAYRLHKYLIPEALAEKQSEQKYAIMILYTSKEEISSAELHEKMATLITKLLKRL